MPLLRLELLRCQCEPNQDGQIVERRTRPRQSGIARSGAVHAVLKRQQQRWVGLACDGIAERSNCRKARRVIVAVQPGCIAVHAPRHAQPRVRADDVPREQPVDIAARVSRSDAGAQPIERLCDSDLAQRNHLLSRSLVIRMSGLKFGI